MGTLAAQGAITVAGKPAAGSPKQPTATPKPAPTLRTVDGATDAELATQLGVTRQAVAGMRKRGTLERNVAQRLPTLTTPHVNGHNGRA